MLKRQEHDANQGPIRSGYEWQPRVFAPGFNSHERSREPFHSGLVARASKPQGEEPCKISCRGCKLHTRAETAGLVGQLDPTPAGADPLVRKVLTCGSTLSGSTGRSLPDDVVVILPRCFSF
jgi:hypothetical protein